MNRIRSRDEFEVLTTSFIIIYQSTFLGRSR